jgi:hypothetical protein
VEWHGFSRWGTVFPSFRWINSRAAYPKRQPYFPARGQCSTNDYHSVMVAVMVMMTPMTMAIRLCISRSREEGEERKHH